MQTLFWTKNSFSNIAYHIKIFILVGSPSVSTENLSRLSRAPSLPRNRGRSGIPVAHHREFPTRGSSKRNLNKMVFFVLLCSQIVIRFMY